MTKEKGERTAKGGEDRMDREVWIGVIRVIEAKGEWLEELERTNVEASDGSHTLSSVSVVFFFFFFCFLVEELEVVVLERLRRLTVSITVRSRVEGGSGSSWERSCAISFVAAESCCCKDAIEGIWRESWRICSSKESYSVFGMDT